MINSSFALVYATKHILSRTIEHLRTSLKTTPDAGQPFVSGAVE